MKRLFSVFLLLAVIVTVFAGCRGSAAPQTTTGTTPTPSPAPGATTAPAVTVTREQAQEIALQHAGFTADQVTRLHTEADLYDRFPHYDVEFDEGGYEYDYEIDAYTGEILKSEKERD